MKNAHHTIKLDHHAKARNRKVSGAFPSRLGTSEKRLRFYTITELEQRMANMQHNLNNLSSEFLKNKIRFEIKTIQKLLS